MKRWVLLLIIAVVIIVASAVTVRSHVRSVARAKREVAYQSALRHYSQDLRLGLKRTEVESYRRARNVKFSWISTAFGDRLQSQYADVVKIGEEAAPWYCSEAYVYIAFEFSGVEAFKQDDADLLERIEMFRPYTGCL